MLVKERRETKREKKREKILDAAAELFSHKSYHEVMMEDVAKLTDVAKGTVYNYFTSKEELYFSIMKIRMEKLINSVKENLNKYDTNNLKFGFIVSCCARLEALGDATFKVYEEINNFYKDIPFLLFFASGEDVYKSGKEPVRLNESFNVVNFY